MRYIAHRGNLCGPYPERENCPPYIDAALDARVDAEVDVWWWMNGWHLGHDKPQYHVPLEWLTKRADRLWVHCKNLDALYALRDVFTINAFWHEHDAHTLTSRGFIWSLPGGGVTPRTVVVDLGYEGSHEGVYGICTDYPL